MKRVNWYCANTSCDNVLGAVSRDGELVIQLDNVVNVSTDGVSMVIACNQCGMAKVWYPTLESAASGYANALVRTVAQGVRNINKNK